MTVVVFRTAPPVDGLSYSYVLCDEDNSSILLFEWNTISKRAVESKTNKVITTTMIRPLDDPT